MKRKFDESEKKDEPESSVKELKEKLSEWAGKELYQDYIYVTYHISCKCLINIQQALKTKLLSPQILEWIVENKGLGTNTDADDQILDFMEAVYDICHEKRIPEGVEVIVFNEARIKHTISPLYAFHFSVT